MWQLRPAATMLKVPTIFFILIPAILSQSTPAGDCCQKRTVSNIASELNGVYNLKRNSGDAEDEICFDGCVYAK